MSEQTPDRDLDGPLPLGGPGWGIASLAVGAAALLLSWAGLPAILLGVLGAGLGARGTWLAGRGRATGRGLAVTGWLLNLAATFVAAGSLAIEAYLLWRVKTGS
ncbi:hypothetical protein [Nocardioides bruguierae]|uniref:hypothetical protein n=1 Tax=Nocardioides bruguierae TaxID=2945102 RepID=UPI002020FDE7|nr:hypothetical protein [Nocardioides bruguierae]MCL8023884.1 hypothetical protein [Nocardioides bruguierae]